MDAAVTIAILAGGKSLRLGGVDKGLQPFFGMPLISHVYAAVNVMFAPRRTPAERQVLILANRNREAYSDYATTLPDDVDCGEGPMAAIATALSAIETPWLLTVPVDCPWPPLDLWQRLRGAVGNSQCAVAHDGEHRQPLFALYRRRLAHSAKLAASAGSGPREWQDRISTVVVDFQDRRGKQFANLNSTADFLAWQAIEND